jgi:hypothetical protein
MQEVTYRKAGVHIATGYIPTMITTVRPDMLRSAEPYAFNLAIHLGSPTNTTVAWVNDGFTGTNAAVMNPSRWGVIETPATVL